MGKKYDIVTAMDLCVDFLVQCGNAVPEFGQKEKLIQDYSIELGGSASIFACQTAKLGLITAGIGAVGDDYFGSLILDKLYKSGVVTENIRVDNKLKTGMGAALCMDGGDRAILTYMGTIDAVEVTDLSQDIIDNTRHLHISSFYLMKRLQPYYAEIAKKAKKAGATISLDTNWDPDEIWDGGIWDVLPYVDVFLPNENEAIAITKKSSFSDALKVLSDKVPLIALKKGKYGASAFAAGKSYSADPIDVKIIDTVGAGDSFDAGFIYGLLSGLDIEKSLRVGCICGSYNTTMPGGIAGQPELDKMLSILEG